MIKFKCYWLKIKLKETAIFKILKDMRGPLPEQVKWHIIITYLNYKNFTNIMFKIEIRVFQD